MVILLATGIFMTITVWHGVAWIFVALGSLVPSSVLAMAVGRSRMAAIERFLTAEHGTISSTLRHLLHHPLLWIDIQTRVAIALGIVFLMSVKNVVLAIFKPAWRLSSHSTSAASTDPT